MSRACFACGHDRAAHSHHVPPQRVAYAVAGIPLTPWYTTAPRDECRAPGCSCIAYYTTEPEEYKGREADHG